MSNVRISGIVSAIVLSSVMLDGQAAQQLEATVTGSITETGEQGSFPITIGAKAIAKAPELAELVEGSQVFLYAKPKNKDGRMSVLGFGISDEERQERRDAYKANPANAERAAETSKPKPAGTKPATPAATDRTGQVLSARVRPGVENRIIGQVMTMTNKGEKAIGFSAPADTGAVLLTLVGKPVAMKSRYTGPGVLFVESVQALAA